jgi:predicted phosphate transport protein (TIGR00153 family)
MSVQSIIRLLLPREDHFYDFLEAQATCARKGAEELASFRDAAASAEGVREKVQALEHEGDKIVHEVEEALARTFVTPIDREDIQKLSTELDTILDLTNGAARMAVLCGVRRPSESVSKLMELLVRATTELAEAMPKLRRHEYGALIDAARSIKKLEKEGDTLFRDAVSALFHDDAIDAKVLLREREVLEDVESALDSCEHVAETLTNLAVKNG